LLFVVVVHHVTVVVCAVAGLYCSGTVPITVPAPHSATATFTLQVTVHAFLDNVFVVTDVVLVKPIDDVDVDATKLISTVYSPAPIVIVYIPLDGLIVEPL
jgi:hypothetical protein